MATRPAPSLRALPDAAAREAALDPARSFLVQAPAGSGKTELLTRRLLALLARARQPEAILALTFTVKAAAEMRDRVLGCLRGADKNGQPLAPDVAWLAAAARQRDQSLGWRLADNPARLRLQTIDSFALGLAAQAPLGSGLAGRTTREDAFPLYRRAARELLRELDTAGPGQAATRDALTSVLAHLDNHWPRVEGLLADMLSQRDQWLPHLGAGQGDAGAELRAALEAALQNVIRAALGRARAAFPPALAAEAVALAVYAAQHTTDKSSPDLAAAAHLTALPGAEPADVAAWLGLAAIFLTKGGERRATVNKDAGFPADGDRAKEMKGRWKTAAGQLDDAAIAALAALRVLPAPAYTDPQWEVLAALLCLLPRAAAHLDPLLQQEGAADFIAYTLAARQALGGGGVPTPVAFAWDARLEHLLVDEFQDTSQSQFDLLRRLTADWQAGDGRTIFLVGDPMQSIYGFRQAHGNPAGLFLRLGEQRRWGAIPLEPLRLSANFRSAEMLTGWFNHALAAAFPAAPDPAVGTVPYAPCQSVGTPPPDAEVQFLRLPWLPGPAGSRGGADRAAETAEVVRRIQQARAAGDGDIAILVRVKHHAQDILRALAAAGISAQSGLDQLGDRPAVLDLLSLTRALLRPADRIAWLAVLHAPWCGLTHADLLVLAEGDSEAAIWDHCQDANRCARLTPAGHVALERCRPVLAAALAARGRQPLHRLVEGTWFALGGPFALRPEWREADAQDARAFLELLASLETAGEVDIEDLSARAANLSAMPVPAPGAVQVMTIHQAKGLEFATVILPQLDRLPGKDASELLAWQELPSPTAALPDLLLAPVQAPGAEEPIYKYIRQLAKQQHEQESVRLLYVAATRAQRRLYLLGGWKPDGRPTKGSLAWLLAPAGQPPEPAVAVAAPHAEVAVQTPVALRRLPAAWRRPAPPPAIAIRMPEAGAMREASFDWARPLGRHLGVVLHAWLSAAAAKADPAPWARAAIRARLAQEGVATAEMETAVAQTEQAMARVLADPRGQWLLAQREDDQREWALAGVSAEAPTARQIRIDRSFAAQGERWIVDYKTDVHAGGDLAAFLAEEERRYAPQLEAYAALLAAQDSRPIRLGLYFPRIVEQGRPAWRSWAYPRAAAAARP